MATKLSNILGHLGSAAKHKVDDKGNVIKDSGHGLSTQDTFGNIADGLNIYAHSRQGLEQFQK